MRDLSSVIFSLLSLLCWFVFGLAEPQQAIAEKNHQHDDDAASRQLVRVRGRNKVKSTQPAPQCASADDRLMLAIRCNDGTERLVCAPQFAGSTCMSPNQSWANAKCNSRGGFDKVLPYYSGCYPKSVGLFWSDYAAGDLNATGTRLDEDDDICNVHLSVPALNLANLDFEDTELGIKEWNKTGYGGDWYVQQKCDNPRRCQPLDSCFAYQGLCYVLVNAGNTTYGRTPPQSFSRRDFRIPEVDATGVCGSPPPRFCFRFAMRFEASDYISQGKDDRFTVKVQLNGNPNENVTPTVLYENTISVVDVGDLEISNWTVVEVPLPHADIGSATFFEFEAASTNAVDHALDSVGYVDDLSIGECSTPV